MQVICSAALRKRLMRTVRTLKENPMSHHGSFSGNPKTEWLVDESGADCNMRLLEDFLYTDPDGRQWPAPSGSIIDGPVFRVPYGLRWAVHIPTITGVRQSFTMWHVTAQPFHERTLTSCFITPV